MAWTILRTFLRNRNDNLNVAYLNWNGSEWYVNFNWLDNKFNSNARLVRAS